MTEQETIDNPVGDDIILGSSSAFLWDESWELGVGRNPIL